MQNENEVTRDQIDILGMLNEGHVLRQRPFGLMLCRPGWVTAPPGGEEAVRGLRELGYIEGDTISDTGRKVWEDWCKANPQLAPKRPQR
jgi:hypothetical protein